MAATRTVIRRRWEITQALGDTATAAQASGATTPMTVVVMAAARRPTAATR